MQDETQETEGKNNKGIKLISTKNYELFKLGKWQQNYTVWFSSSVTHGRGLMKSWALPGRDVDKRDEAVENREWCTVKAGGGGEWEGVTPVIQTAAHCWAGPSEGEGKDAEERGGP